MRASHTHKSYKINAADGVLVLDMRVLALRQVLAGYQSTTDNPASGFYKELMEQFPDAKVRVYGVKLITRPCEIDEHFVLCAIWW